MTPCGGWRRGRSTSRAGARQAARGDDPQGLAFLEALGTALQRNPPPARDRPILRRLATLGIGPGTSPARAGLARPVLDALVAGVRAEAAALPTATRNYVLGQAQAGNGWFISPPRIGDYGTEYLLRARIAVVGLGANTPEEATYPAAITDASGGLLDGSKPYRLTFRRGQAPPNRAFWSLTMYDLDGYLVANSAKRYAVGDSHPPLRRRADGSIVVAIQRSRPSDPTSTGCPRPRPRLPPEPADLLAQAVGAHRRVEAAGVGAGGVVGRRAAAGGRWALGVGPRSSVAGRRSPASWLRGRRAASALPRGGHRGVWAVCGAVAFVTGLL